MSPRPKRVRKIVNPPLIKGFKPYGSESENSNRQPVFLLYEEYESIRLCDFEMLNHLDASVFMEVSRSTFTRIYLIARRKIAEAFVKGRQIVIEGGKVYFDSDWYQCSHCNSFFNNPYKDKPIKNCPLCGSDSFINYDEGFEDETVGKKSCCEICICPKCGYEQEHQIGWPCNQLICPQCNVHLISKIPVKVKINKS
jgi:predicted DNA-binding protein (UPF0251 family)